MTHYPSNEEVERLIDENLKQALGDNERLAWIKSLFSQTRLSDLDAIIEGLESIYNELPESGSWDVDCGRAEMKTRILSYLKSLKENKI